MNIDQKAYKNTIPLACHSFSIILYTYSDTNQSSNREIK